MTSRRGFLRLLGGTAITAGSSAGGGPAILKQAIHRATTAGSIAKAAVTSAAPLKGPDTLSFTALDVLRTLENTTHDSRVEHHTSYADIDALVSVSKVYKARMTNDRRREENLARQVQEFLRQSKLNLVGLSEETLLSIIRKTAGQ